jgi:hypothetical protein
MGECVREDFVRVGKRWRVEQSCVCLKNGQAKMLAASYDWGRNGVKGLLGGSESATGAGSKTALLRD